jgi:alkylation response protein AidB-like acyl-CoA dehydrogenase
MYIMGTLLRHGSEEQKQRYLPRIASGELRLQAFGVTEPTTGSDTTKLKTRAERRGDVYVVTGQKVWTSRALHSDMMLLLARTTPLDQVKKKTDGLSVFLVDLHEQRGERLDIRPIKAMINHNTTEIFMDGLEVPAANLIGEEGRGFRYILDGMNAERVLVASECIGDGRWLLDKAVSYASDRRVCAGARPRCSRPAGTAARTRTSPSCWRRRQHGRRRRRQSKPMAALPSRANTISSASGGRRDCIRWPLSRPTWCCPTWPSTY